MLAQMALATFLRPSWLSPHSIEFGGKEPPKVHWVGGAKLVHQNQNEGGKQNAPQKKKEERGYRELSTIRLGDVDEAFRSFSNYLKPSALPGWVAPNYFCMIPLAAHADGRPSAVFGRVRTCFPGDGYSEDAQEMELFFPNKGRKADLLHLWQDEIQISSRTPVRSFYMRVKFLFDEDELAEHLEIENQFIQAGFAPEYAGNILDLLGLDEKQKATQPRLFVASSRWFDSIPGSVRADVKESLTRLIGWNRSIFNYHSSQLPLDFPTLNRVFDFKHGFSDISFYEPATPQQTLDIITREFDTLFQQGMA